MDSNLTKQRHLRWWGLIAPGIMLFFTLCCYSVVAFGPNLPIVTDSSMQRVEASYDPSGSIRDGDLILLVDDRSPDAWADDGIRSVDEARETYKISVVREGTIVTSTIKAGHIPFLQMLMRWTGPLLMLLASLFVATLVGTLSNGGSAEQGLLLAFLGIAGNLAILPLIGTPPLSWIVAPLVSIAQVVTIGFVSGLLVFFLGYPQPSRFWHPRLLPLATYAGVIGAGLLALLLVPGTTLERAAFTNRIIVTSLALGIALIGTLLSVRAYRRTHDATARAQLRWIAWGMLIGVPPWVGLFAIPLLLGVGSSQLYALSLLPMLAVPISFALAVLRFRLLDVDEVLNRSLVYMITTVGLGVIYTVLILGLSFLLGPLLGQNTLSIVGFLTTLAIAALFNIAVRMAKRFVDRIFYRERRELLRNVRAAARDLRVVEGWSALLPLLGDRLPERLHIEQAMLLLEEHGTYQGYARDGGSVTISIPEDWNLDRPIILQSWTPETSPSWAAPLIARGFQLAFVLVAGGRPVGVYALGRQQSGSWYDRQSIAALDELADRIAGTIENARLIEQNAAQASLRYELAIARRIQESLLPAAQLTYGPLDVAAINLSASDVGGDLYALQERDGSGLTLAVGDVSGKGVPAALMMAVTSAVLTTVSAEVRAPDSVLRQVNRQLKDYTAQNRQNVALCYLSLTPVQHGRTAICYTLEAANAGAIAPLLRHADGTTEWLEIGGLPLGSPLPSDLYPVATRTLHPGDTLLVCTDGLLEAQSADGTLLSFDGVADLLASVPPAADAQTTLDAILAALTLYTDGHDAQDDVTVVVVRIREQALALG